MSKHSLIYIGNYLSWDFREDWRVYVDLAKRFGCRWEAEKKLWRVPTFATSVELTRAVLALVPAQSIEVRDFETGRQVLASAYIAHDYLRKRAGTAAVKKLPFQLLIEGTEAYLSLPLDEYGRPLPEHALYYGLATVGCAAVWTAGKGFHLRSHAREAVEFIVHEKSCPIVGVPKLKETPFVCELYDNIMEHQNYGISFLYHRDRAILADDMGCVDGESIVTVLRAGCSRQMKLKDLVAKFNGAASNGKVWRKDVVTNVRCYYNGELRSMPLKAAYDRGVKPCVKITLDDGKELKCTPDHEIMTTRGWVAAHDLTMLDEVMTNGQKIGTDGYVYINGIYKHPYCPKRPNQYMVEHRLVYEAWLNGMTMQEWIDHVQAGGTGLFLGKSIQIHHKNGVRTDNRLDNLEALTAKQHQIEHNCKANIAKFVPKKSRVKSVEPCEDRRVYDLTIPGADSFVANKVIVHNCGKTMQSIIAAEQVKMDSNAKGLLIICPVTLVSNWRNELKQWGCEYKDIMIVPYSQLNKLDAVKKKYPSGAQLVVIADECHMLKNSSAQRTKTMMQFVAEMPNLERLWLLSGTPVTKDFSNLWPLAFMIKHPLAEKYRPSEMDNVGAVKVQEIRGAISTHMLCRKKTDILTLPPKIQSVKQVDTGEDFDKLFDWEFMASECDDEEFFKHLMRLKRITAQVKVEHTIETAKQILAEGRKVVVFSDHTSVLDSLAAAFPKAVRLCGQTPQKLRGAAVDRFQTDQDCRVFLGHIKAAGVGITLTAASDVVFNDFDWLPANMQQAEDRCYRIGQRGTVNIYYMADCNLVLDDILCQKLADRSAMIATFEMSKQTVMTAMKDWLKHKVAKMRMRA